MGWNQLWSSEIDKFPNAVLAHHYPDIPNLGDMNKIHEREDFKRPDLIMAGTPCQSFSIAGLRKGLADPRGNLTLVFLSIVERLCPSWVVWENVNGVRNANEGRDFGAILGALGKLGYGWCYRVLDAQYFGVPQRRRRVFVVGYLGDWRRPAAVLFERNCLSGNTAKGKGKRKEIAGTLGRSFGDRGYGIDGHGAYIPVDGKDSPSPPLRKSGADADGGSEVLLINNVVGFETGPQGGRFIDVAPTLDAGCKDGPIRNQLGAGVLIDVVNARQNPIVSDIAQPLDQRGDSQAIVGALQSGPKGHGGSMTTQQAAHSGQIVAHGIKDSDIAYSLRSNPSHSGDKGDGGFNTTMVSDKISVRRLLPIECERLMGLPDNYTYIPYGKNGKMAKDSPRYRALGNSIVRQQMEWLARRIELVEAIA